MATNNRILLAIDNEEVSRHLMEQLMIEGGYSIDLQNTAAQAIESFKSNNSDLVIAKFGLPDSDGMKFVRELKAIDPDCVILAYTEENKPGLLEQSSRLGIYDVFSKPINIEKLLFLTKKAMELRSNLVTQRRVVSILKEQNSSLQKQNILLAKRIEESTRNLARLYEDLRSTYLRTIRALAQAIDARDHYTHNHSENVSKYGVMIAQEMRLTVKEIEMIREAGELHDLGKIGISDSILTKPGSLTPEEWEQIKRHPQTGAQILEPLTFLSNVIELVRQHHEHFDGRGYPSGKSGEDILLGARILHISDAYDSMITARSYRKTPLTKDEAVAEIEKNSGTQFDPQVVNAFLRIVHEL
jgi:putative nucleotidyltransferase with HDIG domain